MVIINKNEEVLKKIKARINLRFKYILIMWMILFLTLLYFQEFVEITFNLFWIIGFITTVLLLVIGSDIGKNTFLIVLTLGIFYSFTMPIQDNPDENAHLSRAMYISEGNFGMTDNPSNLMISEDYQIIKDEQGKDGHLLKELHHSKRKMSVGIITATSTNSFISYLPQALGLKIGILLGLNLYWIYFLGRIFNLIAYAFLSSWAVSLSKNWEIPMAFVAMTPMSIFLASSYNQDAISFGVILITIGYFLNLIYSKSHINKWNLIIYSLLCCLIATIKLPYVSLIGLLLFVPQRKLINKTGYWKIFLCIGTVGIVTLIWLLSYLKIKPVHIPENANTLEQLSFIIGNPDVFFEVLVRSIFDNIEDYRMMFLFGWLSYGSASITFIHIFFFGALSLLYPPRENLPKITKIGFFIILIIISFLINMSQYLTWTNVGLNYVSGVQGRYFIGIFAMVPMAFNITSLMNIRIENEQISSKKESNTIFFSNIIVFFLIAMLSCQIGQYY